MQEVRCPFMDIEVIQSSRDVYFAVYSDKRLCFAERKLTGSRNIVSALLHGTFLVVVNRYFAKRQKKMATVGFLIFVIFILFTVPVEAICCNSIKLLMEKKIEANKTLCAPGSTLPLDCCKDIGKEVKKYVEAYKAICLSTLPSCAEPKALGMQSNKIPDDAITASSTYSSRYKPSYARLNNVKKNSCSWAPTGAGRLDSWLQVDLGQLTVVTRIATQGTCYSGEWPKSYSVAYSSDGNNWTYYQDSGKVKVFQANSDKNSIVSHTFKTPFQARYMRIWPKSWNGYPTTRLEYYGCHV